MTICVVKQSIEFANTVSPTNLVCLRVCICDDASIVHRNCQIYENVVGETASLLRLGEPETA